MSLYYQDDLVTLYHGDCLDAPEWREADILVTDPPYGVNYTGVSAPAKIIGDHNFDAAEAVISTTTKPMAIFANHASLLNTLTAVYRQHSRTRVATWHKTNVNGSGAGNPWFSDVEFMVCGVPEWPHLKVSGVMASRRFTGNPAFHSSPDAYLHPTQKPVRLLEMLLEAMPPGSVADPFAGSGTTLIAARNQGRKAVGFEIDEAYCEVIANRFAQGVLT